MVRKADRQAAGGAHASGPATVVLLLTFAKEVAVKKMRMAAVGVISGLTAAAGLMFPASAQAAPTYWTFQNARFGTCLTGSDSGTAYGTLCQGWERQQWDWTGSGHGGYHQLKNRVTGQCLTTDFVNKVNAVWTSACDTNKSQWWFYDGDSKFLFNEGSSSASLGYLRASDVKDAIYTSSYAGNDIPTTWFQWTGTTN